MFLFPALTALALFATPDTCAHPENAGAACAHGPKGKILRGAKLKGAPRVELAALLAAPQPHEGKTVSLEGKVRKACSRKGCWMELAAAEKGPGVRVTFKDYGFFVPLDSAGRTARVEGEVKLAELSNDMAKHYESEGATVPRDEKGTPREVQLLATGVELSSAP